MNYDQEPMFKALQIRSRGRITPENAVLTFGAAAPTEQT
jgi:hypothetical protein